MFMHDPAHSGQQSAPPASGFFNDCGAPFVFNGNYDGMGHFSFSMTGVPGSSNWSVYASTDLSESNWTRLATNLELDSITGNTNFTDSNVAGLSQKFYIVSFNTNNSNTNVTGQLQSSNGVNSGCCSKTIGFVNLTIEPGINLTSDPLYQVDDFVLHAELAIGLSSPMNTLNALFAFSSNAWGLAQTNTEIFKWNGSGFDGDTNGGAGAVVWVGSGDLTLVPGTGVLMSNATSVSFTNTFVGLVREQQVFKIQPGTNTFSTNFLSPTIPAGGYITNITGYVPHNGDTIHLWNTTNQAYDTFPFNSNTWSNGTPILGVGEGFVLITSNIYTWTNTWEECP
jgi:hypothetical protein